MNHHLIRANEVRSRLGGISRQTLWRWRRERGFPEPIQASQAVNLWRIEDVDDWLHGKSHGKAE